MWNPLYFLVCLWCIPTFTTTNYYLKNWETSNDTGFKDYGMVGAFNNKSGLIQIVGGYNNPQSHYVYNITSNTITKLDTSLSAHVSVYCASPNGYTSFHNMMYFSTTYTMLAQPLTFTNLFQYDMNTSALSQIGLTYPKPIMIQEECYTTNDVDMLYLIGGYQSNVVSNYISNSFLTFNITSHTWAKGPKLHIARKQSACIYHAQLFVFGGAITNANSSDTIETIHLDLTANHWHLLHLNVSKSSNIQAFKVPRSDTVFIIGSRTCDIFDANTLSIQTCPPVTTASSLSFMGVYVHYLQRFYSFSETSIQYASIIDTIPLDVSLSSTNISIGERVPVIVPYKYNMYNHTVQLVSTELNINSSFTIRSNLHCVLFEIQNTTEYHNCSHGVLPMINGTLFINDTDATSKTFYVNVQGNESIVHIMNGFSISINAFINFSASSTQITPGSSIPIIISNMLLQPYQLYSFRLVSKNEALKIDNILQINTTDQEQVNCSIFTADNPNPVSCMEGVVPLINYNYVSGRNNVFNISVEQILNLTNLIPINIVGENMISVAIQVCKPGEGMSNPNTASCELCVPNSFTLRSGIVSCHVCDDHQLDGIYCEGGNEVMIAYNYWGSALSNDSSLYPLIDIIPGDAIYSVYCPPSTCCNAKDHCNYFESYNGTITNTIDDGLCVGGRDVLTPLCGSCMQGLSELFGSNQCGFCRETNYLMIVLIFVLYTTPFTIYVAYFASSPIQLINKYISDQISLFNVLLFGIYFYYFQCLSVIFASKGITVSNMVSSITLALFNLQIITVNRGGMCIIPNLTSFGKLMINFMYPISYLVALLMIALINRFTNLKLSDFVCCLCYGKRFYFIRSYFHRNAYILNTLLRFVLLYLGISMNTLFQILTAIRLPDGTLIHYYAPNKVIHASTIVIAVLSIGCVWFIFCAFFHRLWKQSERERYSSRNVLKGFVSSFKSEFWYWEFVIGVRRVVIAIYGCFQFLAPVALNLLLCAFILAFIVVTVKVYPFKALWANRLEVLCLCSLQLTLICLNFVSSSQADSFSHIFAAFCIIVPLILLLIFFIRLGYIWSKSDQNCCRKVVIRQTMDGSSSFMENSSILLINKHERDDSAIN
eukprot:31202_1